MNTTENNKLIAEFMGWDCKNNFYCIAPNSLDDGWSYEDLKFHSDWNWLMQVIEKIESFEDENRCSKYNVEIQQSFVSIIDNQTSDFIYDRDANTKLEAVYNAVVEFINFYNSAQKEN